MNWVSCSFTDRRVIRVIVLGWLSASQFGQISRLCKQTLTALQSSGISGGRSDPCCHPAPLHPGTNAAPSAVGSHSGLGCLWLKPQQDALGAGLLYRDRTYAAARGISSPTSWEAGGLC